MSLIAQKMGGVCQEDKFFILLAIVTQYTEKYLEMTTLHQIMNSEKSVITEQKKTFVEKIVIFGEIRYLKAWRRSFWSSLKPPSC